MIFIPEKLFKNEQSQHHDCIYKWHKTTIIHGTSNPFCKPFEVFKHRIFDRSTNPLKRATQTHVMHMLHLHNSKHTMTPLLHLIKEDVNIMWHRKCSTGLQSIAAGRIRSPTVPIECHLHRSSQACQQAYVSRNAPLAPGSLKLQRRNISAPQSHSARKRSHHTHMLLKLLLAALQPDVFA